MSKILTPYGDLEKIQTANDAIISLGAEFLSEFLHSKLACPMPICVSGGWTPEVSSESERRICLANR